MRELSLEQYAELDGRELQFEQQPGWLALLQRHCAPEQTPQVYLPPPPDADTALPLYRRQERAFGLRLRRLSGVTGLYSSHYAPPTANPEALQTLLSAILVGGDWDALHFEAADENGSLHRALTALAERHHWPLVQQADFEHWYLPLQQPNYDAYARQLPGALRSTLKRKGNKLGKRFEVEFRLCRTPEQLPAALQAYQTVYASSWKAAERHPEFIPQLCQWAARQGWLRLGTLHLNGQPVAAQIWLVLNQRASIFKLAYDQAFRKWSVGSLLTARMMRQAIDNDRVHEIEYGRGGESYKRDWMSHCRQRIRLDCFNPATLAGRALALRHCHLRRWRTRIMESNILRRM